jgi:GT2 family glycosyltransferase
MNLVAMTPFREDMNLGRAYNEAMELLPYEDGWAVLMDHDIMFTTIKWNEQIREAIKTHPTGTFTGVTNRIWSPWQRSTEGETLDEDILKHRACGERHLADKTLLDVTDWRPGWGGMLMVVSKKVWADAGGFRDGMECVDHKFHQAVAAAGHRLYCIKGLYVYHFRTSRIRGMGPWSLGCCRKAKP